MWERSCVGCGAPGEALCPLCAGAGPLVRVAEPIPFVREARVADVYDSGLGRAVTRAKGAPDRRVARRLAAALAERARSDVELLAHLQTATAVSWIPSPWPRRLRRGFGLAVLLADRLAGLVGRTAEPAVRVRPGRRQATRDARGRVANLRGRIRACREWSSGTVILVDDVVTTGATASSCSREILGSGATSVVLIALCRASPSSS